MNDSAVTTGKAAAPADAAGRPEPGFKLLRYFSVSGLVAIVVATVLLSTLCRALAVKDLREIGERNNVALTQAFANVLWPRYGEFLSDTAALDADALRAHPRIAQLHGELLQHVHPLQIAEQHPEQLLFDRREPDPVRRRDQNAGHVLRQRPIAELLPVYSAKDNRRTGEDFIAVLQEKIERWSHDGDRDVDRLVRVLRAQVIPEERQVPIPADPGKIHGLAIDLERLR